MPATVLSNKDFNTNDTDLELPDTQNVPDGALIKVGYINQSSAPTVNLENTTDDEFIGEGIGAVAIEGGNTTGITLTSGQVIEFVNDQTNKRWIITKR